MIEEICGAELDAARKHSKAAGKFSWTSDQYQAEILQFIYDNRDAGNSVVEVGCFRGGLSILLAAVCKKIGAHLYTMDIDPQAVASTQGMLNDLGYGAVSTVHHGPLSTFELPRRRGLDFKSLFRTNRPILCILDGDHAYAAVRTDLEAVERLRKKPFALAFHDYSLRHPTTDERVDEAVRDHFGPKASPQPLGLRMNGTGHPTKDKPQPDGHYWQVPGSEGGILVLG